MELSSGPRFELEEVLPLKWRLRLEPIELRLELLDVLELSIDGGEAHVSDPVQILQPSQGELAHTLRVRGAARRPQLGPDPVDQRLELLSLDRALDRGPLEPGEELGSIEGLA